MKAIRVHEYGPPEVLRYEDCPRPEPGNDEVLVRVAAAGVNPFDWKVRSGMFRDSFPLKFPWIPGSDFSGVIERVGSGVTDLRAGEEVFGQAGPKRDGSYAQFVSTPRSYVQPKPETLDHVIAAAVPAAAMTAWQALFGGKAGACSLELARGDALLILGATGGVGSFAVQFAKWKGARVIATSRQAEGAAQLSALGADAVIDPGHLEAAGQVDAVLDLVGGELQARAWPQIRPGGAFASTVDPPSEAEAKERGVRSMQSMTHMNSENLAGIARLIDTGTIQVIVGETLPLESAARAHERLQRGGAGGKIVLIVE